MANVRNMRWQFKENWEGWTGVRYYPADQVWKVRVQAGRRFETLRGDDPPHVRETTTGPFGRPLHRNDWYFSDPKRAIEARERCRQQHDRALIESIWHSTHPWPPDHAELELKRFCVSVRFGRSLDAQLWQFASLHSVGLTGPARGGDELKHVEVLRRQLTSSAMADSSR